MFPMVRWLSLFFVKRNLTENPPQSVLWMECPAAGNWWTWSEGKIDCISRMPPGSLSHEQTVPRSPGKLVWQGFKPKNLWMLRFTSGFNMLNFNNKSSKTCKTTWHSETHLHSTNKTLQTLLKPYLYLGFFSPVFLLQRHRVQPHKHAQQNCHVPSFVAQQSPEDSSGLTQIVGGRVRYSTFPIRHALCIKDW